MNEYKILVTEKQLMQLKAILNRQETRLYANEIMDWTQILAQLSVAEPIKKEKEEG